MILSFFHNAVHLLTQLQDTELLVLALKEIAKLIPYVTSSRKSIKIYLKVRWQVFYYDIRLMMISSDFPTSLVVVG